MILIDMELLADFSGGLYGLFSLLFRVSFVSEANIKKMFFIYTCFSICLLNIFVILTGLVFKYYLLFYLFIIVSVSVFHYKTLKNIIPEVIPF